MYMEVQTVFSLRTSGRTKCIAMDSCDGVAHAVPFYEFSAIEFISATNVAIHAVLSVSASGRAGIVMNSDDGLSHTVPIHVVVSCVACLAWLCSCWCHAARIPPGTLSTIFSQACVPW